MGGTGGGSVKVIVVEEMVVMMMMTVDEYRDRRIEAYYCVIKSFLV